jgi:hypothetical protein
MLVEARRKSNGHDDACCAPSPSGLEQRPADLCLG